MKNESPSLHSTRRGFTLVELLVVLAVIGVLVALLLPAVQQIREAARRAACQNNLKQLGLSLHNFESAFKRFPPGYAYQPGSIFGPQTGYPVAPGYEDANHLGHGWGSQLLPFVEQSAIHDSINFKLPSFHFANISPREIHIGVFLCPTDNWSEDAYVVRDDSVSPIEQYAGASYAANWGPAHGVEETPGDDSDDENLDATPDLAGGVFFRNSRIGTHDIVDGLSHTLAFGERTNGPILDRNGIPLSNGVGHIHFENTWFAAVRDINVPDDDHGHMVLFDCEYGPNQARGDGIGADRGLSAPHGGLAQFTFCDGSVQTVSQSIDTTVYRAISSRDGGEVVGEF